MGRGEDPQSRSFLRWSPDGRGQSAGSGPCWAGGRLGAQGLCPHLTAERVCEDRRSGGPRWIPGAASYTQSSHSGPTSEPETRHPSTGTLVSRTAQGRPGWASAGSRELGLATCAFQGPAPGRPLREGGPRLYSGRRVSPDHLAGCEWQSGWTTGTKITVAETSGKSKISKARSPAFASCRAGLGVAALLRHVVLPQAPGKIGENTPSLPEGARVPSSCWWFTGDAWPRGRDKNFRMPSNPKSGILPPNFTSILSRFVHPIEPTHFN